MTARHRLRDLIDNLEECYLLVPNMGGNDSGGVKVDVGASTSTVTECVHDSTYSPRIGLLTSTVSCLYLAGIIREPPKSMTCSNKLLKIYREYCAPYGESPISVLCRRSSFDSRSIVSRPKSG